MAISWSEMAAESKRDESAADDNESNAADSSSISSTSGRQVSLTELRGELLYDATYVRSDGTAMPPVVVTGAGNGNADDADGGCGSTESYSYDCELLIVEQRPSNGGSARSNKQPHRQETAVARHVGDALVRNLKSRPLGGVAMVNSSRHGVASARSNGRAVMEDSRHSTSAPSDVNNNTANDGTATTMSTPRKIIGSIGSMAWGLAQVVSPVLTKSNVGRYDGMEDEDIAERSDNEDDAAESSSRHLFLDDDRDTICHVGLMVECVRLILGYAATEPELDGQDAKLLYRFEKGPQSLAEFCRLAASASLSVMVEKSADHTALCETLSGLSSADLELLLLAMVSAGYAVLSLDGDVVALLPKHGAGTSAESAVDEVNLAIFRLQTTVTALERRIEHLSEQADAAQARAVTAKKKRQSNLGTTYLKLRNLRRAEIDRTSASLLNVEQSLQTLHRTRADAEVVKAYKLAGEAMKMARKSEEEGGLGLNTDDVEAMTDELAELTEEINETSAMLENAGVDNGVGDFSEEELLRELDTLEDVDDLADALASTGIEDGGNVDGAVKVETKKDTEKVDEKAVVEKEAVGEGEGDCDGSGMKKEAVAS